jgi:integrase/DNA-directed RNA polymerase subunit RPC12/RpoP
MSEQAPAEKPLFQIEAKNGLRCPECGSTRLYKSGKRKLADGSAIQRYLCRDCCYRFSENSLNKPRLKGENDAHGESCLLMEVQGDRSGKRASETREPTLQPKRPADVKAAIIEFTWWMKKCGYSESTIIGRSQILKRLVKLGADLFNPESVSNIIAQQDHWSPGRKANVVYAYALFAKWAGLEWQPPKIAVPERLPFVPQERELLDLIAGCSRHVAVALQIALETGARVGEIFRLRWEDVDFESQTIRISPEKGSKARIFKMSSKLCQMLNTLPKTGQRILSRYKNVNSLRRTFEKQRRRMAFKLGNPRLLKISFHTFRHFKGTMEYYKTKDILHVMQILGHKRIQNTLKYVELAKFESEDQYICKIAKTPREIAELIQAGFSFVCEKDGLLFFRKPK